MIQYFFDSLMGVLLLSGLMTVVVGSVWVLVVAIKELLETLGVDVWKNYGEMAERNFGVNAQPKRRLRSGR